MTLLVRVDNNNFVEIADIDTLRVCRGKLLEKIEDAKRMPMGLAQKIVWLEQVNAETTRIMDACDRLGNSYEDQINNLSWHGILERIGACINFGLGPLSISLVAVRAVRSAVAWQVSDLGQRELKELDQLNASRDPQTMPILHLYDLIGKLQPSERHYLKGLANRLMIEKAYGKALDLLEQCPEYPNQEIQRMKIMALKGSGRYDEAMNIIAECKIAVKDSPETPKVIELRAQLDDMKADCLVGAQEYRQAREVLETLVTHFPSNNQLKRKMIFATIFDEMQQLLNEELKEKFFLQRAKMQFHQLEEYLPTVWGQCGFESDFDFWLFVLCSNPVANEKNIVAQHVMNAISDLIASGFVSVPSIEKGVKQIATVLQEEVTFFKKQFSSFMEETSSKDIPVAKDIQEAVQNARLEFMEIQIYGDKTAGSNAGILCKIKLVEELISKLTDLPEFQKSEQKTLLCTISLAVHSAKNDLNLCLQGLNHIRKEGYHPLADKLTLALTQKANGVLALEGNKQIGTVENL